MSDRRRRWLSLVALSATCLVAGAGSGLPSSVSAAPSVAAALGDPVLFTVSSVAAAPASMRATTSPPDEAEGRFKLVATIQALDTSAQRIWLVTGMGLVLRVVQAEVAPSCQIKVSGETARLGDLKPGTVVRAECLSSGGKLVAVVIETVPTPAEGRQQ